ncbi:MAG: methionyl-tRNA formyltransferase [Chitinispirillia bacterium]|nr:methionyl-tRNA formyltransferase [Chitinispirillia bacterium]
MKIVFMGSAEFGLPALEMLLERHEAAAVVSTPAKPKGRGLKLFDSPVTEFAKSRGIDKVLTPENLLDPEFINQLTSLCADLFVVVAFRILPRDVYSIPRYGTVNIHASLLPRYRGAAPIHRAIEAGESETGVTVFRIDEGVDTGEIILQKKISIHNNETTPELYERLSTMGADALREAIDGLTNGNVSASMQNQSEATRAPKLSRQEGHIDWKLPSTVIFNKIRAFKPFPGTYCFINGKRVNIEWAGPVNVDTADVNTLPGTVLTARGDYMDVQCGHGILRITKVKPEGRPSMDVRAFLLGHSIAQGSVLE